MADVDVTITDNSGEVLRELNEAIEKALTEIGLGAEGHAKDIIFARGAVDTGLLRNSITWAIGGQKANITDYKGDKESQYRPNAPIPEGTPYTGTAPKRDEPCVYVGSNVEYAPHVENGARSMSPRPYIKPAIEDFRDEYKEIIENNLKGGG